MLLTTQIKEQARTLTGYVSCSTHLGKIPAPPTPAEPVTIPLVPKDDTADDLAIPGFLQRQKK